MASHSLPIPLPRTRGKSREGVVARRPSVRVLIAVSVALLILFSWLRMILALEIASTGRKIQLKTEELESIERGNDKVRLQIARALSPERLAPLAEEMGFQPQEPIYIHWSESAAEPADSGITDQDRLQLLLHDGQSSTSEEPSLLDIAADEIEILLETTATP